MRKLGRACPNEPEFRAYYLMVHLYDPLVKLQIELLPNDIFLSPIVQQTLKLCRLAQSSSHIATFSKTPNRPATQNLIPIFFREIASDSTPYLLACLAEYHFVHIRRAGLYSMMSSIMYLPKSIFPLRDLTEFLDFDSNDECKEFCLKFSMEVVDEGVCLGKSCIRNPTDKSKTYLQFKEPNTLPENKKNTRIIEHKRQSMGSDALIDGSANLLFSPVNLKMNSGGSIQASRRSSIQSPMSAVTEGFPLKPPLSVPILPKPSETRNISIASTPFGQTSVQSISSNEAAPPLKPAFTAKLPSTPEVVSTSLTIPQNAEIPAPKSPPPEIKTVVWHKPRLRVSITGVAKIFFNSMVSEISHNVLAPVINTHFAQQAEIKKLANILCDDLFEDTVNKTTYHLAWVVRNKNLAHKYRSITTKRVAWNNWTGAIKAREKRRMAFVASQKEIASLLSASPFPHTSAGTVDSQPTSARSAPKLRQHRLEPGAGILPLPKTKLWTSTKLGVYTCELLYIFWSDMFPSSSPPPIFVNFIVDAGQDDKSLEYRWLWWHISSDQSYLERPNSSLANFQKSFSTINFCSRTLSEVRDINAVTRYHVFLCNVRSNTVFSCI